MTARSPISIPSDTSSDNGLRLTGEDLAISMLLTPDGALTYGHDTFTQAEFECLETKILERIQIFCRTFVPRDEEEHRGRIKLYKDLKRYFELGTI
ncbi:hypothetical protein PGT21_000389 [Puccinia graminis f. sp. tritici]|uniref:Uncharacterized protein n=1 Tax=Puccinia graminis f. sp. tritici TaxID=56615 RepID=A0A5B0QHP8_PUCGR|nr:hypothetical protein PGT21_000389 [Puccinia graminis f. sp. tritici]